ncbi:MAG: TIM barrel protein [Hyphomonadaceae bacterium]|nr:TIM barrel protein [Hyphomonadaceae bacterium]
MKLSACIEWLFADETESVPDRIRAAAACGLYGVEFHQWRNKPLDEIERALDETGLALTSFIVEPRRSLVDAREHAEFLAAVRDSLPPAQRLRCPFLIVASGFTLPHTPRAAHHSAMVGVLKEAAAMAEQAEITLILEPLNDKVDHPGMYLVSVAEGLDVVEEVASPGLKLIYDGYHASVMGDAPGSVLQGRMQHVAHVQIADMPGRGAPGTGQIDWTALARVLHRGAYAGAIGLEYKINDLPTRQGLRLAQAALERAFSAAAS